MDIRLISLDMDGTLYANNGKIPEINIRALQECHKRGIYVMLNSGRSFESLCGTEETLGVPCVISSANGARVDMDGKTVSETVIEYELSRETRELLINSGCYFCAYARSTTYMFNLADGARTGRLRHEFGEEHYADKIYTIKHDYECPIEGIYKYVCFAEDNDERFIPIAEYGHRKGMYVSSSWRDNIELMPVGADKGTAIKTVSGLLGIQKDQVMAFGDNRNDTEMFLASGHPVAMANSEQIAFDNARYRADTNVNGGVGLFIYEHILKERI